MRDTLTTQQPKWWAVIGKAATVIGVVAAIIGIYYNAKTPDRPQLQGICVYRGFALPPDLVSGLDRLKTVQSYPTIQQLLTHYLPDEDGLRELSLIYVSRSLADTLDEAWPKDFRYDLQPYKSVAHFSIENKGKAPANDVVPDFPWTGIALVTGEDQQQEVLPANRVLRLGTLRPAGATNVVIWTIAFPVMVTGFSAWVARNFVFLVSLFAGAVVIAILIGSLTHLVGSDGGRA